MKKICQHCFTLVALLLLSTSAKAQIVLTLSDDGTDLTLHYTGTMDLVANGYKEIGNVNRDWARTSPAATSEIYSISGDYYRSHDFGTQGQNTASSWYDLNGSGHATQSPSNGVGLGFGFRSNELWWDTAYDITATTITVDRKWTVAGATVASFMSGETLDISTPQVIWTNRNTGSTISLVNGNLSAVPEPTSMLMFGIGMATLVSRRRAKRRV